jgi:hypothetical protein
VGTIAGRKAGAWARVIAELRLKDTLLEMTVGFVLVAIFLGAAEAIRALLIGYQVFNRAYGVWEISMYLLSFVLIFKAIRMLGRIVKSKVLN